MNNKRRGRGIFEWANGEKYDGDWKDNTMEGKGHYTWPDGRSYIGDYVND